MTPPAPATDLARRDMPSQDAPAVAALDRLSNEQIRYVANTEIVPKHLRGKPDAMLATILKGRALGLDDIHSLTAINFIDGRATLSAESMVALVRSKGHSISWELKPGESCTAKGKRKDSGDEGSVTWTMGMARDAGLAGSKDNWRRHPDTMLTWRAISQLCRFLYADVLMGVSYTEDEALEASERGAVSEAVSNLPALEEQHVRTEARTVPPEAQLNRIAGLEQRVDGYQAVLRGVFGVEMATELTPDAAIQYEAVLEMAATPIPDEDEVVEGEVVDEDSGQGAASDSGALFDDSTSVRPESGAGEAPQGDEAPTPAAPTDSVEGPEETPSQDISQKATESSSSDGDDTVAPSAETDSGAGGEHSPADAAPELPDEPAPIGAERMAELAATTVIPIGQYRGKKLGEIHDGWLEYGMSHTDRLPPAFVEALELYVRERKPEMWAAKRG